MRPWDTRVGTIDLQIPKLRQGSYFPAWLLEPRRWAEKALTAVVAEAYALGVSTRKVEDLVQALGIEKLSKSQVSQLAKELDAGVKSFRERPLLDRFKYLWLDALVESRGRAHRERGLPGGGGRQRGRPPGDPGASCTYSCEPPGRAPFDIERFFEDCPDRYYL